MSYDRGDSWIPLGEGLYPEPQTRWPGFGTEAVAFDPQDKTRTTLWIATRWDSRKGRILCGRERDGRFVWEERFQSRHSIGSIVFAPSRPERVYAAAGSRRSVLNRWSSAPATGRYWPCEPEIYRSDDGGKAWRKVGLLPVPGESKHGHVFTLAVSPEDPNRVYAASDRGVYRSADGGQTWQELGGLPHRCAFGLALDPKRQGTLYATLLAFEDLRNLAATKANATALFRSSDDGRTWQRLSVLDHPPFFAPGIWGSTTQFFDVVVNPASPSRLYVACTGDKDSAVFRSEDSGKTWQRLDKHKPGFLPWFFPQVLALHAPSQGEDHVFVLGATAGQYRSLDGGRQFEPFASERLGSDADPRWRGYGLEADGALSVAAAGDPNKPDYLLRAEMDWGISLSYDYGITFRHVDSPWNAGCRGACLDPSNQRIIYGIFHPFWAFGPRFVRSVDGGKTFDAEPRTGLPKLQFTDLAVDSRHLAADDAATRRRLYVCLQSRPGRDEVQMGGVYVSSDGGATWKLTDDGQSGLRFPNRVLVHPRKPDMVFATQLQGSKRSGSL
ncbi:MAG: hypothetical protein FJ279_36780, partial [Planctomycetes bacterium]|nr:hypothetical protein [Planctomycetota bacterium]